MKKQIVAVSAALLLAGSISTADAQYGHRGGHGGHWRGPAVSHSYGGGYAPYGYGDRRHNNNGGAFAAGLVSSLILGSLVPGLGGLGAIGYGQPYGAYDPYSYGYQPGYSPYPVVYRPVRQRVIYVPRVHRVPMRARMVRR